MLEDIAKLDPNLAGNVDINKVLDKVEDDSLPPVRVENTNENKDADEEGAFDL